MVLDLPFKCKLILHLSDLLDLKINEARNSILNLQEAKNNDTKSSAGDKYETGRAMIQMELDKAEFQLSNANHLKSDLISINTEYKHEKIGKGSLVSSNWGVYLIAVAFGKTSIQDQEIMVISYASPIGQLLSGKTIGDKVVFNNRSYEVLDLV